jgi:hypothetical protein
MSASTPNLELLDAARHRHLRLRPTSETKPHFVQIVADEFARAAACCPVLFTKEAATGRFFAGAMFAFKPDETFLHDGVDRGGFTPLSVERDGFFIAGEHIAIDRNHPRFSETQGEPLFDVANQPGIGLRRVQRALGHLKAGHEMTDRYIGALAELKLIEPIDISLSFDTRDERLTLQGLFTVSLDGIRTLSEAAAMRLLRAGYLQLAYTMSASLEQIRVLARVRDQAIRRTLSAS